MRLFIPPHTRVQGGERVDVRGYFRTVDSLAELDPDEKRAYHFGKMGSRDYPELDSIEKESGGYRVAGHTVRAKASGGVVELRALRQHGGGTRYRVRSATKDDGEAPWHDQGTYKTLEEARARFLKLKKGTLRSGLFGLTDAQEHLLELTRVWVLPHTRITEHGPINVDGYWRDIDFDPIQTFDFPNASAAFEGMRETPHEVQPGQFIREREVPGYLAEKYETFEVSTKKRPGRTPTPVTVTLKEGTITPTIHVPEGLEYGQRSEYIRKTLHAVFRDQLIGYRIKGDPAGFRTYGKGHWFFDHPDPDNFPDGELNISFDDLT